MTNDDRSNEDRPDDGQGPSWGAARDASSSDGARYGEQADAPRYGEQADAPRYGEQANPPRYGEQADAPRYGERAEPTSPAPQYGEQQGHHGRPHDDRHAYGQNAYGQDDHLRRDDHTGAPSWNTDHQQPYAAAAAPNGAPAWQAYDEPKRTTKKKTVGVVAFIVALLALALAVIAGAVLGNAFGSDSALRDSLLNGSSATQSGQQELEQQMMNNPALLASGGGAGVAALIGTLLGIWAIIQGIIAIVTKRGRAFGVVALIIAVVSPIVLYVVLGVAFSTQL